MLFISHKTKFNKLNTEKKISAVSNLHLVSQKTLDVPKISHNKKKHVKLFIKKKLLLFCSLNSMNLSIKILETIAQYY